MSDAQQPSYFVVIPAAGVGSRMVNDTPKQYIQIHGQTLLEHALSPFVQHAAVSRIAVVLHADDAHWSTLSLSDHPKIITTVGGETRAHSVLQGLQALRDHAGDEDWVMVHDAARPGVRLSHIDRLMRAVSEHAVGGLLAVPVHDTLKKANDQGTVFETVAREKLWAAQTPQLFRVGILCDALTQALSSGVAITDESSAVERLGYEPLLVPGDRCNFKVTTREDLTLMQPCLLQE